MKLQDTEVELLPFISEVAPPSAECVEADTAQAGVFPVSSGNPISSTEPWVQRCTSTDETAP